MKRTRHDIRRWFGGARKALAAGVAIALACATQADNYYDGTYWWNYQAVDGGVMLYGGQSVAAVSPDPPGDLTIPSTLDGQRLTQIGEYAFYVCDRLARVTIPSGVTSIGVMAFSFCDSLESVTIPRSVTSIGAEAFFQREQALREVRVEAGDAVRIKGLLDAANFDSTDVQFIEGSTPVCIITLNPKGGSLSTRTLSVTRGRAVGALPTPTRSGYTFLGWFTTVRGDDKIEASTIVTENDTYYAHWAEGDAPVAQFRVTFGKNGGTGGDAYVTATEGQPMPTPRTAPTKSGWTFAGYWTTTGAGGVQYYDGEMKSVRNWDKTTDMTLWAKWTNRVTFGKNGGTGGDSYVTATEGQPMPTPRNYPSRTGWVFDGYWDTTGAGGKQYYDAEMKSMRNWDKKGAVTLWAKWHEAAPPMRVTFGKNGGTGGDAYVTATEGQPMPTPRTAPTKSGWTFAGYWDTLAADANGNPLGKQYYDASMKSVRKWDKTTATTLWAKWTVRVTLGKNGGTGGDSYVTVTFNQPFPKRKMPTKAGYTFGGFWVSASSRTGQCYNADGTGTASMKWSTGGTPTIWALWTVKNDVSAPAANRVCAPTAAAATPPPAASWICTGVLADGAGTFSLLVDEGGETAFLSVEGEDGSIEAECDVLAVADGVIVVVTEDEAMFRLVPGGV